jgi:hypothetical protein
MSLGFTKSKADSNLYYKVVDGGPMILLLHVNDMFLIEYEKLITKSKRNLATTFETMHYLLDLEVWEKLDEIFMCQGKYVVEILKKFRMMDCKSMPAQIVMNLNLLSDTSSKLMDATIYGQMIGLLTYLMNTRIDICFAVNILSQYMVEPRHVHLVATKYFMR